MPTDAKIEDAYKFQPFLRLNSSGCSMIMWRLEASDQNMSQDGDFECWLARFTGYREVQESKEDTQDINKSFYEKMIIYSDGCKCKTKQITWFLNQICFHQSFHLEGSHDGSNVK